MEAQRATDNIQQKASDCLGTENEKPYTLGRRIIDANEAFALIRGAFSMIEALQKLSKQNNAPKFKSGGIVKKPEGGIFLNGIKQTGEYDPLTGLLLFRPLDDNPKKD